MDKKKQFRNWTTVNCIMTSISVLLMNHDLIGRWIVLFSGLVLISVLIAFFRSQRLKIRDTNIKYGNLLSMVSLIYIIVTKI